ncbi:hypothetical protein [Vibrio echinoideorum]|uniref:hypothetical protein n=1 Tax=Vibrio echinoideorum TaxID=2100116 RepID=UPI00354F8AA8
MISKDTIEQLSHAIIPNAPQPQEAEEDIDHILLKLATQKFGTTAALASKLNVDESQIHEWLKTPLPIGIIDSLENIVLGDKYLSPHLILSLGGLEQMEQWQTLINALINDALHRYLSDIPVVFMPENTDFLCERTLEALINIGMELPREYPKDLQLNNIDDLESMINANIYAHTLSLVFDAMVNIQCYYDTFFDAISEHPDHPFEEALCWEHILVDLAVYHALDDQKIYPGLQAFQNETMMNTHQYINALKSHAYQHRLPLRAELLHLLNKDHEELYDDSEAEIMGLFPPQIHPDIYVSEIIESQRLIHQVLPGICRKLEMSEEEIKELIGKK